MAGAPDDPNRDLGLGSRLTQRAGTRFLNRDGSFNVLRVGLPLSRSLNIYHTLITTPWRNFFGLVAAFYLIMNFAFASAYLAAGPGALEGATGVTAGERYSQAFFFSVQTFATIGYGVIHPKGLAANLLVTIEALVGLMSLALATGILFARFSRPQARILFSDRAVVAPYRGITGLMFRIANERSSQMIDVEARVSLSRNETADGRTLRRFYNLGLERSKVNFFPLHWVVVHPIDELSPLHDVTPDAFAGSDAEILVLLSAVDETFSETVHRRTSYKFAEVVWGARFRDMFVETHGSRATVDMRRLGEIEKLP
jgi:inward rectifier potassium channel